MKRKKLIIWLIVLAVIGILLYLIFASGKKEVIIHTATVSENTIEITVMATGYVQPVDQVEVGTQVSGVIERIYVDFNSQVKRGQLLAELDKSTLNERLNQSNASYQSALSNLTYAEQNFARIEQLYNAKAATQVAYEEAVNSLNQARNSVANAKADVQQAEVNLSYATITSPIDGIVLERSVEEGQTVAASFSTPELFIIANDLTNMQVEADVDEADIGRVRLGQRVTFTVDAYHEDTFEGTVNQIRLQPTTTNNVVTYTVIIGAPNPDEKLFPGMTANIEIVTESVTGLTVPVEALNFRMTEEIRKGLPQPPDGGEIPTPEAGMGRGQGRPNGPGGPQRNGNSSRGNEVWIKNGDMLSPRQVVTGIDDGVNVIVVSGLTGGQEVVLSAAYEKKTACKATSNPLLPSRPGGGRR